MPWFDDPDRYAVFALASATNRRLRNVVTDRLDMKAPDVLVVIGVAFTLLVQKTLPANSVMVVAHGLSFIEFIPC
jgi:hypothetical protein